MGTHIDLTYTNPYTKTGGLFAQTGDSTIITNTTVETTLINGGVGTLTVPAFAVTAPSTVIELPPS